MITSCENRPLFKSMLSSIVQPKHKGLISFRPQFWRLYLFRAVWTNLLLTAATGILWLIFSIVVGVNGPTPHPVLVLSYWIPIQASVVASVAYAKRVCVGPEELHSHEFLGFSLSFKWESLESAEPYNFFGLPYFRICSHGTSYVMWLPVFLAKDEQFVQLVEFYAGQDNPLTVALRGRFDDVP